MIDRSDPTKILGGKNKKKADFKNRKGEPVGIGLNGMEIARS